MKKIKKIWSMITAELKFLYFGVRDSFSHENSFFSSKKIERALFVMTALFAANYWFYTHVETLTYEMVIAFSGMFLGFAGYSLSQTQKEKKFKLKNSPDEKKTD